MMMKIGIVLPDLRGGGAERSVLTVARGLHARGHNVELVLTGAGGDYRSLVGSLPIVELRRGRVLAAAGPLTRQMRAAKYDVVFGALNHVCVAMMFAAKYSRANAKTVVSLRNTLSQEFASGRISRLGMAMMKRLYPAATRIHGVSHGVARDGEAFLGLPEGRVTTIYNPVFDDVYERMARETVEHPWFTNPSIVTLVAAGRLNPQKRYDVLLESLCRLPQSVRLIVLGDGAMRDELIGLSKQLNISDRVDWRGFVENPVAYMKQSDAYVMSSDYEGLPGSLIQAMGVGTRLVSTDCPNGPREVLAEGRYGVLTSPDDPQELAEGIALALSKPKCVLDCSHRQKFELDCVIKQYEEMFATAL